MAFIPAQTRPTGKRHLVLMWLCLAAAVVYIQRTAIGVITRDLSRDLNLGKDDLGWVMGSFYWAYALAQVPSGWFGARAGSRRGLVVAMVLTSLLCGAMSLVNGFWMLICLWSAVGIAIAGVFPCCAQTFAQWFPETERARASGFLSSSMSIGAAISTPLTAWLVGEMVTSPEGTEVSTGLISWRGVFALYALPGLLWAMGFGAWFRNRPEEHPGVNEGEVALIRSGLLPGNPNRTQQVPWGTLILHPKMWLVYGQQFFRAAGYVFYATWFVEYLQVTFGLSKEAAGTYNSFPFLGVVLGGILGGPFSDYVLKRTGSRRLSRQMFGMISQFACALLFFLAWQADTPGMAVGLMALGSMIFAFGSCCSYTIIIDLASPHVAPGFAIMNMMGNLGAGACAPLIGWYVKSYGWDNVLLVFVAIYALSGLFWVFINPNGCVIRRKEETAA